MCLSVLCLFFVCITCGTTLYEDRNVTMCSIICILHLYLYMCVYISCNVINYKVFFFRFHRFSFMVSLFITQFFFYCFTLSCLLTGIKIVTCVILTLFHFSVHHAATICDLNIFLIEPLIIAF